MKDKVIKYISKLKSNKLLISFIISFAILFNICTYTVFAKYISDTTQNINLQMQKPIIEVETENMKELIITSDKVTYDFKIKNYNDEQQINKMSMEYYIEIISDRLDIFKIELYKEKEKLKLNNYKTDIIELPIKEKKLDEYHLEVFPLHEINEDINTNIQIQIKCTQKK